MNYSRYICQIKKVIFLGLCSILLFSCAQKKLDIPVTDVKPLWFKSDGHVRFIDGLYQTVPHLFFDVNPKIDLESRELNAVILVEKDGDNHYELDLVSGRRVFTHSYCREDDVWKSYPRSLKTPPFHYAFVPRLINRQKNPQKVIIFGDKKYLSYSHNKIGDEFVRVRIIGGIVEQFCDSYPCDKLKTWRDSVILVAVAKDDPEYKDVKSITKLKSFTDWKRIKSFLENGRGRSIIAKNTYYPAYRVYGNSVAGKSMKFALESGHLFSIDELNTLGRTCEALYEKAWNMREKVLKDKENFHRVFSQFYNQYWNSFNTCKKYVRSPRIKDNHQKHWYFEFLHAFSLAHRLGYVYKCDFESWEPNQVNYDGKLLFKQEDFLRSCSDKELNSAFPRAVNLLSSLAKTSKRYYKYIEYEQGRNTYNEKIYNWIALTGKRQLCSVQEKTREIKIFPNDVEWQRLILEPKKEDIILR